MARAVRTDSINVDRETSVRAILEQTTDADHAAELTLRNGSQWVYALDDDQEATFLRCSETTDDVAATPDPPQWVQQALNILQISLAE